MRIVKIVFLILGFESHGHAFVGQLETAQRADAGHDLTERYLRVLSEELEPKVGSSRPPRVGDRA